MAQMEQLVTDELAGFNPADVAELSAAFDNTAAEFLVGETVEVAAEVPTEVQGRSTTSQGGWD